jgi:tRNA-splicing ligase RtcB
MVTSAAGHGIPLPDRELASVPIRSPVGRDYFGAMLAAANCALANREILTHFVREVFERVTGDGHLPLLYDVSHNVCSLETHAVAGRPREVYVHRKGATRAFGPGLADVPDDFKTIGQPVLIGGSMGTSSYILAGTTASESLAFSSACHGAGRSQSRSSALKQNRGEDVVERLRRRRITIKTQSLRGVAEEAPTAYKNVADVVDATHAAGLARKVVRVDPLICVKG